jgi:capsular exopolysaccharide synthesis family protein
LDNRIRTPRDAELITGAPAIGAIAYDAKAKERPLIVHADPSSPRAESFRALRTNLQFLDMGGRSSFVITSSIPSEGKSTTTINLAIALADAGKRVALLDTDLRKPKVAEYLGIEGGAGLTDVLIGRADVRDVMLPWGGRSLYVLPAGKIPPNPSELLGSTQMGVLLGALENDFDVVLCDGPPLLPVTDAAILSRLTSGALMVVAAGRTTKHQLTGATEALNAVDAKLAGFVMSMVPTRGPDSYYSAYGYGYGYGSVYGYGEGGGPVDREPKTLASLRFRTASTDVTGESEASGGSADPGPRRTAREVTRDA